MTGNTTSDALAVSPVEYGWLDFAVDLAENNVRNGGGPFAALLVRNGQIIGKSGNQVTKTLDPTAHAEIAAIRIACREIDDFKLNGALLVSSCEPCPMCLAAALWARIDRVLYAADRYAAAAAGFDDLAFYEFFARPRQTWAMTIAQVERAGSERPFTAWRDAADRIDY